MSLVPRPSSPDDERATKEFLRLAAMTGGTVLGSAIGGPAGDATGLVLAETAAAAVEKLSNRFLPRFMADTSLTLAAASSICEKTPEDIVKSVTRNQRSEELVVRALTTTAETSIPYKAWVLGRVIANAAADSTHVLSIEELIVESIRGLRSSHNAVLVLISTEYEPLDGGEAESFWRESWIAERVSGLGAGVTPVLKSLESAGLVVGHFGDIDGGDAWGRTNMEPLESIRWLITPYGRLLQERLRQAEKDGEPDLAH